MNQNCLSAEDKRGGKDAFLGDLKVAFCKEIIAEKGAHKGKNDKLYLVFGDKKFQICCWV